MTPKDAAGKLLTLAALFILFISLVYGLLYVVAVHAAPKPAGILVTEPYLVIEADSLTCKMPEDRAVWMECVYTIELAKSMHYRRVEIRRSRR